MVLNDCQEQVNDLNCVYLSKLYLKKSKNQIRPILCTMKPYSMKPCTCVVLFLKSNFEMGLIIRSK